MSGRLGLEVTPSGARAVLASAWRDHVVRTFTLAADPRDVPAFVDALRAAIPTPDEIAVAIGLGWLHVARVELPPSGDAAREAMVQLDPPRFFAVNAATRAALVPGGAVAFAADAAWLDALGRALEGWAPVARIEAAPVAIAAAVPGATTGTFAIEAAPGEQGLLELRDGRVAGVRRIPPGGDATALRALPNGGVPGTHLAAWGALCRMDAPLAGTLMGSDQRRAASRRIARSVWVAGLAAVAGLTFLVASADRARERTLIALEGEAARLTRSAQGAVDAHARLALVEQEGRIARAVLVARPEPAAVLATLGTLLPRDVVVLGVRATGDEWQVDGTARDAAALIPLLDADPRLDAVRSLAASSRFRDGREVRESFSIAFHVRPAS